MQQTNKPDKFVIPFANSGARNTIPSASQIGVTAGRASLTDGFPPLTRTPISAGGAPPSGLDMNGILYGISAVARWANAGGGYAYDSSFATDPGVNGYPKGARVMRSDGTGYWLNTVDNNASDPEGAGAAAAGWVPDFTNGVAYIAMSGPTVTLTPSQYGKPIIVITGALTSNLSLIFPSIVSEWTVINTTTGPYTITCKTSGGTGVVVNANALIFGDGTNIQSAVTDSASIFGGTIALSTGGTSDAITATFSPAPKYATPGIPLSIRASVANTTSAPTFTPNAGVIAAKPIVKGNNLPLAAGDIAGGGHWIELQYDATLDKWVLLNPAKGVIPAQGLYPGTPLWWLTPSCPSWALVRDGSAISRAAYPKLFAALCPTRSGTTAAGTNAVTGLSTTADMYVGMPVEAVGIPAGTTVSGISSATAITISANATASATVPITLFYYGYGSGGSATTFGVPDDRGLFERALDTGARGYEATVITGTTTSGNNAITGISSTKGLFFGQAVSGTGIPGGATVASITSATAITISSPATARGTVSLTFVGGQIGNERADDFKSHYHTVTDGNSDGTQTSPSGAGGIWTYANMSATPNGNYNSTNATGGAETRPRFRSYLPIVVY